MILQELFESKSAPLYHFTRFKNLISIIESNTLYNGENGVVSFTRNKQHIFKRFSDVCIAFNKFTLSHNYKLTPSIGQLDNVSFHDNECEEYTKTILNVSNYIDYIVIDFDFIIDLDNIDDYIDILKSINVPIYIESFEKGWYKPTLTIEEFLTNKEYYFLKKWGMNESKLYESKTAPLYHATSYLNAYYILTSNVLKDTTTQFICLPNDPKKYKKCVRGVSLTRDLSFAQFWGNKNSSMFDDGGYIVFSINQEKLNHNHKVIPVDYFNDSIPVWYRRKSEFAEAEEFVVGKIENFMDYVNEIIVPERTFNIATAKLTEIINNVKNNTIDGNMADCYFDYKVWSTIIKNPKCKKIKKY